MNFFSKLKNKIQFGQVQSAPVDIASCFLIMSNARSGSSYFQSSLSALGAYGDFEFAFKPYGQLRPHQRFVADGISDIAAEMEATLGNHDGIYGSKLTLPIYDFLSIEELKVIVQACSRVSKPIHLVRHYWDLLKSNLSRGVAHDFIPQGQGWTQVSQMYKAYSALPGTELGREKESVKVSLGEEECRKYLMHLVRNDYVFGLICEGKSGLRVRYETLNAVEAFKVTLDFLGVPYSTRMIEEVISRPALRKLPAIPDSNMPFQDQWSKAADICYQFYAEKNSLGTQGIYKAQIDEIKKTFS